MSFCDARESALKSKTLQSINMQHVLTLVEHSVNSVAVLPCCLNPLSQEFFPSTELACSSRRPLPCLQRLEMGMAGCYCYWSYVTFCVLARNIRKPARHTVKSWGAVAAVGPN